MLNTKLNHPSSFGKMINATAVKKNTIAPFKDHPHFALLVDTISRKHTHHAILQLHMPQQLNIPLLEAFTIYLTNSHIPLQIRDTDCIYIDISDRLYYFEDALQSLKNMLDTTEKYLIVVFPSTELLARNQISMLINHPKCRLLILTNEKFSSEKHVHDFISLTLPPPSEFDISAILKHQRIELENFHHVIIPDEVLTLAYSLAQRYLSMYDGLEKTLLLLDSCAARAGMIEQNDPHSALKPILTQITVLQTLSEWVQIPASHLQFTKFNFSECCIALRQKIFGQETAITLIGQSLQRNQAKLQDQSRVFLNFLFIGPKNSGKKTAAIALTDYLFKHSTVLFYAQSHTQNLLSIWDLKFFNHTTKKLFTLDAINQEIPYAFLYIEDIDTYPSTIQDEIGEILSTGTLRDQTGNLRHFHHTSFILSTSATNNRLNELAKLFEPDQDPHTLDLMELVSRNTSQPNHSTQHIYSSQEIADELTNELATQFPAIYQHIEAIPFFPLNRTAIENIFRAKLKTLGKQLNATHNIELGYAPEVLRYLTNEATKSAIFEINKSLKQLYLNIEQSIFNQSPSKNHTNQLFLQLNENGQALRCEWLHSPT